MEDAIRNMERLCQEKLLVFYKLLAVFRNERKAIIKADVASLWTYAREKRELAENIHDIRRTVFDLAEEAGLTGDMVFAEYSMAKILAAVPVREKGSLVNVNMALNEIKRKIAALSHENRMYLQESLKTIEDLVHIITRSCVREERYGRETYMRPTTYGRTAAVREGV